MVQGTLGIQKAKTTFIIIPSYSLLLLLAHIQEYSAEFSRSDMTCNTSTDNAEARHKNPSCYLLKLI